MITNNELILVDNDGVTFSNDVAPQTAWQTQDTHYTLWFEPSRLSVKLKYVLPIRLLVDTGQSENGNPLKYTVKMDMDSSEVFSFVPRQVIVGNIDESLNDVFNISWGEHWYLYQVQNGTSISNETIVVNDKLDSDISFFISEMTTIYDPQDTNQGPWAFKIDDTHILFTFYIMCCNEFEETVLKNIRVNIFNEHGTLLTDSVLRIGATFYDESEELFINAQNQGIVLPHDICKAFWECGFNEYHPDRTIERDKLKELLFNYMGIRGECGNYASAIKSLEWFGWGEKLELSQLLVLNQNVSKFYLNDFFDIFSDIPADFSNFRRTTFLSIKAHLNKAHHLGRPILSSSEGTTTEPSVETLYKNNAEDSIRWKLNKDIFSNNPKFTGTKVNSGLSQWEMRYHYIMHEFALKLSCLAYLYEVYLLPVQLNVVSSTVVEHISTNPLKLLSGTYRHVTQGIDNITLENEPYITWGQTSYTVQLNQENNLDSYIDLEFFVNTPENYDEYISVSYYLSSDKCLKYSCTDGIRVKNTKTRYTSKINLEEIQDPTSICYLSVLLEGHWFETEISIHYPDYTIQVGSLEYDYDLTNIESRILLNSSEDYDANLMLSRKYDNAKAEDNITDIKDPYINESLELVSELQQQNVFVPTSRKNLIFTKSLENIFYEWIGVNELEADNIKTYSPSLFHGITYENETNLTVKNVPHTFKINDKERTINYCLASSEEKDIFVNVPVNTAYVKIFCIGKYSIEGLDGDKTPNKVFCVTLENNETSMLQCSTAVKLKVTLYEDSRLYGIEFISTSLALQIKDLCEVKTTINDSNINVPIILPFKENDRTLKISFESDSDQIVKIKFGNIIYNEETKEITTSFSEDNEIYTYKVFKNETLNDNIPLVFNIPKEYNCLYILNENTENIICKITLGKQNTLEAYPRKLDSSEFNFKLCGVDVTLYFDAYIVENVYHYLGVTLKNMLEHLLGNEEIQSLDCSYLIKYTDGVKNGKSLYNLLDMSSDIRKIKDNNEDTPEDLKKLWITLIVHELDALQRSGNFYYSEKARALKIAQQCLYYLQIISKQPVQKLFDTHEKFLSIGLSSLSEDFLKKWKRENLEYEFNYYNSNIFNYNTNKTVKITPQFLFLITRHKFVPQPENDTRFVSNTFFKDDIVAVRIANKYTDTPFIYHYNKPEKEYRFEFIPSFIGAKTSENYRSKGISNYVIMERTDKDSEYLQPGYYNILFKFNYNNTLNENKLFKNIIKIKPQINSRLYNDIYSTVI